jgi:hypothetical protein
MRAMDDRPTLHDVTGTVRLDDPAEVAATIDAILSRHGPQAGLDRNLLYAGFAFAGRLYAGSHPGYLACDMPYHDLRHALDAALTTARLVDGGRRSAAADAVALAAEHGLLAVLLALLHDTGFLRTSAEASLCGPQLAAAHEARSVAFASAYLATTSCAHHAHLAELILATRVATAPSSLLEGRSAAERAIGCMIGSADLLCQMADARYLERCFHHLYPELVLGGGDRRKLPDGSDDMLFPSARDVVLRTPAFYDAVVRPRLEHGLGNVARHLAAHFDGPDPYAAAIRANLDRCAQFADGHRWDQLGPPPPTTTTRLDPVYRAQT